MFVCECVETLNSLDRCLEPCLKVSVCLQAVECYTQALSEAGGQSQRAACSALSCLQVSGLRTDSDSDFSASVLSYNMPRVH